MRQEKLMIMQLQLDIRESSGQRPIKKIKRSMRLLNKDMAILFKGLPHPKGKNVGMGSKCNKGSN